MTGRGPVPDPAAMGCPIIVLTYPHAGDELLTRALSASPSVACTNASGLLPLCQSAISTWQNVENPLAQPSQLAVKSVRSLLSSMSVLLRSRSGAARWCETSYAGAAAARAFLRVFPEAAFICLHRSVPEVITDVTRAYPWGLGGSPLWRFSADHPGNNLATITAFWTARTTELLDFEADHPQACLRVRHEDLLREPRCFEAAVLGRLGLAAGDAAHPGGGRQPAGDSGAGAGASEVPWSHVPPQLLERASALHSRLGYDPLPR